MKTFNETNTEGFTTRELATANDIYDTWLLANPDATPLECAYQQEVILAETTEVM